VTAAIARRWCLEPDDPHAVIPARCHDAPGHDGDHDWAREPETLGVRLRRASDEGDTPSGRLLGRWLA